MNVDSSLKTSHHAFCFWGRGLDSSRCSHHAPCLRINWINSFSKNTLFPSNPPQGPSWTRAPIQNLTPWETEAGGSRVQGSHRLHSDFEASLGYLRFYQKERKGEEKRIKGREWKRRKKKGRGRKWNEALLKNKGEEFRVRLEEYSPLWMRLCLDTEGCSYWEREKQTEWKKTGLASTWGKARAPSMRWHWNPLSENCNF